MAKENLKMTEVEYLAFAFLVGIFLLFFVGWFNLGLLSAVVLLALLLLAGLLFYRPWYGLLGLFFLRPSLDRFGNKPLVEFFQTQIGFNELFGGVVFVWGLYFFIRNWRSLKDKDPRFFFILLFLLLAGFSLFYSESSLLSLREFLRIGGIFFVSFAVLELVDSKRRFFQLCSIIILSLLLPALVATSQFIHSSGQTIQGRQFRRLYGTLYHPNILAFLMVLALAVLVLRFSRYKKRTYKWAVLVGGSFYFLILLGTYTRGGWIAFFIFAFLFGLFYARKALLVLFGLGIGAFLVSPLVRQRVFDFLHPALWGSILWRLELWGKTFPLFFEAPVFGHGLATFKLLAERTLKYPSWSFEAHNDYLRLGVELGAAGLLTYLSIWLVGIKNLLTRFFQIRTNLKPYYLGGALLLFSFLIVSFGDNVLRATALQWMLWAFVGGLLGLKE